MPVTTPEQAKGRQGPPDSDSGAENRFDPKTRRRLSGPALRSFFNIAARWQLSNREQQRLLGCPAESTFFNWKAGKYGTLSFDQLERISLLLGTYKALHIIFADAVIADNWIRQANINPLFGGASALGRMLSGSINDLYAVRRYLDAWRGG